jgi:hypothetical protein
MRAWSVSIKMRAVRVPCTGIDSLSESCRSLRARARSNEPSAVLSVATVLRVANASLQDRLRVL